MLGQCRRRVLVCDAGASRNRWSHAVHGYLTRDSREAQFVAVAAAEGAEAGMAINKALLEAELRSQNRSSTPSRTSLGGP